MHIENLRPREWIVVTDRYITHQVIGNNNEHDVQEIVLSEKRTFDDNFISDGMPIRVKAISPPFILGTGPIGTEVITVNTKKFHIVKATKEYVRAFKKVAREQKFQKSYYLKGMEEE